MTNKRKTSRSSSLQLTNKKSKITKKKSKSQEKPYFKGFKFVGEFDDVTQFVEATLQGRHYLRMNEEATVYMIPGMNPGNGMLCGTNCYAVGTGPKRFLIDAAEKDRPKFLENIEAFVRDKNCAFEGLLITHSHYDHMDGALQII